MRQNEEFEASVPDMAIDCPVGKRRLGLLP